MAENEAKEPMNNKQYAHFVVHEKTGKAEILQELEPGVASYTFDPEAVSPRDIRYIIETTCRTIGIDSFDGTVKIRMEPLEMTRVSVILDIRNRTDITIGIMQLSRWK